MYCIFILFCNIKKSPSITNVIEGLYKKSVKKRFIYLILSCMRNMRYLSLPLAASFGTPLFKRDT